MTRLQHLPKGSFARSLWRNGLGHTDQIAIEPAGADLRAGNYLWRVSTAAITQASDFSVFPEHDRALMILSGQGVRLTHESDDFSDTVELPPLEPYEFPGDIRSRCELLGGPVQDLSVFFRKGELNATLEVVRLEPDAPWEWTPGAAWNFLFAVQGSFTIGEGTRGLGEFQAGDAFRAESSGETSYSVLAWAPQSVFVSIALWR